jgi:hypothetical protein
MAIGLREAHARYVLGDLYGEDLPGLAVTLLETGLDSPAMRELAGLGRPTLREAGPTFERMLAELGEPSLSEAEAINILGAVTATLVFKGKLQPGAAADKLGALWLRLGQPAALEGYWELADEYGCRPDDHTLIDHDVRQRLRVFLANHDTI